MTLRAWLVGAGASAETVTGRVEISDGDTIMVLMEQRQLKVRLADIDAPEKQAGVGNALEAGAIDLCFRKDAS